MNFEYRPFLVPALIVLIGLVMVMAGAGGGRLGGRIVLVIVGSVLIFSIFIFAVARTI
jgi:hypothetical protein